MTDPIDLASVARRVMVENGFEAEFSAEVGREVARLNEPRSAPSGYRDLRSMPWSSIDNRESRDLDQVEVAERNADDSVRVSIGVADVASMVPINSAADDHAAFNTTSVYTGVVTFPMLPERLSTDLTSLNEGEDRYAVVVQFDVAADGTLGKPNVFRALVHNHAKLSYNEVGPWLEGDGPIPEELASSPELEAQVRLQDEAARRLRAARNVAGALNFENVEAAPVMSGGKVIDLAVVKRNRARDLIEDFMVAANRSVAMYLLAHGSPSLRRVVREPRRWDRIVALAAEVGDQLPERPNSAALSQFLARRRAADPEHFADLSLSVVKLLGPGVYVLENPRDGDGDDGHFGLAVADYVHSTAPNRRFADLVTQRMLFAVETKAPQPYDDAELTTIAARCTERADAARKVERQVRKVAGAAMLADRVGDSFAAIIVSAGRKSMYARLLNPPVEGKVVSGGQGLDVGDTVRLRLVSVDPLAGHIDFAHDPTDVRRKLERSRRKKAAAQQLKSRVGEYFDAEVTGVTPHGTWVRTLDGAAEGRVMVGAKGLANGQRVRVRLVRTDTVHGFIDFAVEEAATRHKVARAERKRALAKQLRTRIGERFAATITGVSDHAVWLRTQSGIEGRLVRGYRGLGVGDPIQAILLCADPVRGHIDFAAVGPLERR